ncbi:MAG: tetratricopeptide repeat protein [Sphaerochaeta sp.]|jgi:tetratricopeptide (TPR) repeat protein|uniref:Beta-barrel assembly-enhancing protease n=1 Tax=bioreactor metagenome TaxID=1076179 RepID=A0A644XCY4_9ZZZZ|nr:MULTISPECIES: tetratricopeptide repeat protein [Sphaerochaeta]MDT3358257.1 tetratricopeptide repeat protein [Spirochaetota bacterium]MDD2394378.1 tetratricopeptide repeat protein [Sphaerochaeta sp.]MDD3424967.1 tetratricopeptide repeat protein [Sphaerochaeta sp.]MDD4036927.1 tetratricopeptide repeat protein [Sphaerochaeta sp.]MDX9983948.1 tetratricopeptide repeat protein [Sphaerochaeta sp.]
MSETHDALKNILFIKLPASMERDINNFHLDSTIEIPVQKPEGSNKFDPAKDISIELIVAGMLKVLAYHNEHEHAAYYRDFVLALQPDAIQELTIAAIAQEQKHNFPFAEELFLTVCHLAEQSATYINLATLYSRKAAEDTAKGAQYDMYQQKALETLKEGLSVVGEDAALLSEIGFFHLYQGNVEIAKEYLDRYLSLAAEDEKKAHVQKIVDDIDSKLNDDQTLMRSYDAIQMNKEDEAVALLDSFLADNPKVWNAWFLKGWALRRMGNYREAEQALLAALANSKGTSDIYNELAICSLETGKSELAKNYLNTAVDLDNQNITLISNLAYLYLKDRMWDEAREYLETARSIDPNDPLIIQLMKDYEKASGDTLSSPIVQEFVDTEDVVRQTKQEKPFFIQGKEETDDLETEYDLEDSL